MKKLLLLLFICSFIAGCNQTSETIAFNKFKKQIPYLTLPYKVACYDTVSNLPLRISDSAFKAYAPPGASGIVGIIIDTDFYSAILYTVSGDMEYPVIQTYDPRGRKLNDIGLINGTCCGTIPSCTGYSWGEITRKLSIVLIDSERIFKMGTDSKPMAMGSHFIDSIEIYNITNDGYIRLKSKGSDAALKEYSRLEKGALFDPGKPKEPPPPPPADSIVNTNTNATYDSTKVIYKIQILSSPTPISLDDPRFKVISGVEMYQDKNAYKYTAGHFTVKQEALIMQIKLRQSGFSEAFVVAFKGKKRM